MGLSTTRGDGWLTAAETRTVLSAMSIPLPQGGVATTAAEAAPLAAQIGFPVAVKLASHTLVHKTEIGGVHLNLSTEAEVRAAYNKIAARLTQDGNLEAMEGVLVQPMVTGGVEVMAGMVQDPSFGPLDRLRARRHSRRDSGRRTLPHHAADRIGCR